MRSFSARRWMAWTLLMLAWGPRGSAPSPEQRDLAALEYAFRFASALDPDPTDKARAQEAVVLDYAALGAAPEAIRLAQAINGWRRGTVYADIAAVLARKGERGQALDLLEKARRVQGTITDWHAQRIDAHIAHALAALGEVEPAREIAAHLASDERQYAGQDAAIVALGLAAAGNLDAALESLASLDARGDLYAAWWRTTACLEIAKMGTLPREGRRRALDAARRSSEGIPGWKRSEALADIAEEFHAAGDAGQARGLLAEGEDLVTPLAPTMPVKGPLLVRLARARARLGDHRRARALLRLAEDQAADALVIDRPAIYAEAAVAHGLLGDEGDRRRLLDAALSAAEGLRNARPRALAAVEICRTMGRLGISPDERDQARLEALYDGLGEPW